MDGNSVLQTPVFAKQTWAGLAWKMVRTTEATDVLCYRGKPTSVSVFQYVEIHLMFMELSGCSWSALEARGMLSWRHVERSWKLVERSPGGSRSVLKARGALRRLVGRSPGDSGSWSALEACGAL